MKKVLLTISVANFKDCYVGTLKVSTLESIVPVIMQRLAEAGIPIRGYETQYLAEDDANPMAQATWLISEIITDSTGLAQFVNRTPAVDQKVFKNFKAGN